jgi:hypothetical protein
MTASCQKRLRSLERDFSAQDIGYLVAIASSNIITLSAVSLLCSMVKVEIRHRAGRRSLSVADRPSAMLHIGP